MMVVQHLEDLANAQALGVVEEELDLPTELRPPRAWRWVTAALFVLGAAAGGVAYARHLTAAPQSPVVAVGDETRPTAVAPIPNAPVTNAAAVQTPATAETPSPIRTKPTPVFLKPPRSLPRAAKAAPPTTGLDDPGF